MEQQVGKSGGRKEGERSWKIRPLSIYLSLFHDLRVYLSWGYCSVIVSKKCTRTIILESSLKLSEVDKLCMQIYLQENVPVNAISEW